MRNTPIETKEFPEEGYSRDDTAQLLLDGRARWKRRQYIGCAWGIGLATTNMIVGGWLQSDPATHAGWGLFAACSIYALVLGVMHPKRICSACGKEFEKRWVKGEGEMEDLFLVCDFCKKYVFAHEVRS